MNEAPKRLAPTQYTLIRLFARSGNQCAFPDCKSALIDDEDNFIGQVCHIEGVKGERFNATMSNEQRRSLENLILFCYPHHKKTDNVDKYSVDELKEIKKAHEAQFDNDYKISETALEMIYDQLKEIKVDTSEILTYSKKNDDQQNYLASQIDSIKSMLNTQLQPLPGFLREIEAIEELKKTKNYRIAIDRFEKIKIEDWEKLSNVEKYKITANIGLCYLSLQHTNQAAAYLIEAVQYDLQNHKALSFASLGYAITNDHEQASEYAKKAISLNEISPYAYVALIMVNEDKKSVDDLLQLIPSVLLDNAEICFALGMSLIRQEKYTESKEWFDKVLQQDEGVNFFLKGITAAVILKPFSDSFLLYSNQLSEQDKSEIRKAIVLLKEAWAEIEETGPIEKGIWLLVNLSFAYRALNDFGQAYYFIKQAIENGGNDLHVRWNYAVACFEFNRHQETIDTLNQLIDVAPKEDSDRARLFRAEVHLKNEHFDQALSDLEYLLQSDLNEATRIGARRMLVSCHIQCGKLDIAKAVCTDMIGNDMEALHGYILLAKIYGHEKDINNATQNLDKATALVIPGGNKIILQQIADEYLALDILPKAISILESITNTSLFTGLTKVLLRCYYRTGELNKALALCELLTGIYGPINVVTELQCHIYHSIGDTDSIINISLKHLEVYPDDQIILLKLILLYAQIKKWSEIGPVLEKYKLKESLLPMHEGFELAKLYITLGKIEQGLSLAYTLRKKSFLEVNAHSLYFHFMLEKKKYLENYLAVEEIGLNARVIVEWGNENIGSYTIISPSEMAELDELPINDSLAKKLLRKKVGDEVSYYHDSGNLLKGKIVEVLSKYVVAEYESLHLLQTEFKQVSGFHSFEIGQTGDIYNDFKPLFQEIDSFYEHKKEIEEIYGEGCLTIGGLAKYWNRSIIETWAICVNNHNMGITSDFVYRAEEKNQFFEQISVANGLVIDIISLLTLASLDQLRKFELLPCRKVISAPCLEIIYSYIESLYEKDDKPNITIVKDNGEYKKQMTSVEEIQEGINHYEGILKWLLQHVEVLPCNEALNINSFEKQQMDEVMGKVTIDSILLAKEHNYLLLSDETIVRSVAANDYDVSSISSYILWDYFYVSGCIDDNLFCEVAAALVCRNYKSLPISAQSLLITLKWSDYKNQIPFTNALNSLDESCAEDSVIQVSAIFFYLLIMEDLKENQDIIIHSVLDRIIQGRNTHQVLTKVVIAFCLRYGQNEIQKKLFLQIIVDYGLKIGVFKKREH